MNGDQAGHTAALLELAAHQVPRSLGRDHDHIHIFGRNNLVVMDVEAVSEDQGFARGQVGQNFFLVYFGLILILHQNLNQVRLFGRFSRGDGFEAVLPGQLPVGPARTLADHHPHSGIAQVLGMRVALAAVSDNGHGLVFEAGDVRILIIIHFHRHFP